MPFVLDSSVALAWVLPDEGSAPLDALADRLEQDYALVPAIWPLEIGNALLVAQRRGRIKDDEVHRLIGALDTLPIEVDWQHGGPGISNMVTLARTLGLSTYDAGYIELARRRAIPLATLDEKLRDACRGLDIPVLP